MVGFLRAQAEVGAREPDLQQPSAVWTLSRDERGAARGATLLRVIVGKDGALARYAVDVRRVVAHHAHVVGADIGVADVVAKDDEDVGFLRLRPSPGRYADSQNYEEDCSDKNLFSDEIHVTPLDSSLFEAKYCDGIVS